jgi:hypothetical protein
MFQTKVVEKIKTYIAHSITFSPENREKMRKDMKEPNRSQIKTWRLCTACWIPKATNTLSEPLFPRKQWFHERASMLR